MKTYDLNLLAALDALLATGSVTAAAERVHLSTPAMSHALARIREVFGDPILVRAGRAMVPTAHALALAEPVRQLLAQAEALRAGADAQDWPAQARRFVVRAPEGYAVVFGAPALQALRVRMPRASLQLLPATHQDALALREARIDVDIGMGLAEDAETEARVLSQQAMLGAARCGHPLLGARLTTRRWAAAQHVDVVPRPGEPSALDAALARRGLRRTVDLAVPNAYAALIAAARSELLACVNARMARGMAEALGLQVFDIPLALPPTPVRMVWHRRHASDPAHAWLRQCLGEVLSGTGGLPPVVPAWRAGGA
ncbi:LysR family transcriptional regulator [Pseudorhodoferax sp.]|uniref:LysR family transcriptional regulator n=1 Tax=Pseudorhodoferax sp. TaxID=1993553 RepID=UPI002DD679D7|nr:LysR family transcriptional regulator [Pseudorhodoferax sp.]